MRRKLVVWTIAATLSLALVSLGPVTSLFASSTQKRGKTVLPPRVYGQPLSLGLKPAQTLQPDRLYEGMVAGKHSSCSDSYDGPASMLVTPFEFEGQTYLFGFLRQGEDIGDDPTPYLVSALVAADGSVQGAAVSTQGIDDELPEIGSFLFAGAVTGTITEQTASLQMTGFGIDANDPAGFCEINTIYTANRVQDTGSSDLSVTATSTTTTVSAGSTLTYELRVRNNGPDPAPIVILRNVLPQNTSFSSVDIEGSGFVDGSPGESGEVRCILGKMASGETRTVRLTLNVLASPGETVTNSATVSSPAGDPNTNNNSISANIEVKGGGVVLLVWDQTPPTEQEPVAPPTNLRVQPASASDDSIQAQKEMAEFFGRGISMRNQTRLAAVNPSQQGCLLTAYNIYISLTPQVQLIPANLWRSVPPGSLQATVPAAPAGTFYVVTAVWNCGGVEMESRPSNEVGLPAGPTVDKVKVSAKIKANGTGFQTSSQVFIDGVGFARSPVVSPGKLVQKGSLSDGRTIQQAAPSGSTVLLSFRNGDGGIGTFSVRR